METSLPEGALLLDERQDPATVHPTADEPAAITIGQMSGAYLALRIVDDGQSREPADAPRFERIRDNVERGVVVHVASVEVCNDVSGGTTQALSQGVVHATIPLGNDDGPIRARLLDRLHGPICGASVAHDVFKFDATALKGRLGVDRSDRLDDEFGRVPTRGHDADSRDLHLRTRILEYCCVPVEGLVPPARRHAGFRCVFPHSVASRASSS